MIRLTCGLALLMAMNTLAAPEEKAKSATTPEEAMKLYGNAWMSKKPNDRFDYLIQPFREAVEIADMIDAAYQRVAEAAEKKFPPKPKVKDEFNGKLEPQDRRDSHRPLMPWFTHDSAKLLKLEVVAKKEIRNETVLLLVREKRHGIRPDGLGANEVEFTQLRFYLASKEEGGWKLFPATLSQLVEKPMEKIEGKVADPLTQGVPAFEWQHSYSLEPAQLPSLELEFKKYLAVFEGTRKPFSERVEEAKRLTSIAETIVAEIAQGKYPDANQAREAFSFYWLAPPGLTREDKTRLMTPKESKPTDSEERRVMIAKHTAAVEWIDGLLSRIQFGRDPVLVLREAQNELSQANLDLAENDEERLKVLQLSVYFTREIEVMTQALLKSGSRARYEVAQVQVECYKAELALVRFKAKLKK